ncbi:MAG: site-2 protease family protein [Pyrobaculum sp.]
MYSEFRKRELTDMAAALIILSIGFSIAMAGGGLFGGINWGKAIQLFPIALFILFFAFLGHEAAHRQVARRLGYYAFFQADYQLLPLAIILPLLFGFIFAAPGAVVISPFKLHRGGDERRDVFLISAAGPLTNIILAAMGAALFNTTGAYLWWFFAYINAWLAFFNLLPLPPLDGSKMFRTNLPMWAIFFGGSILALWLIW